jgi:catechol 2,3-dioxygenase-like lactoylglutathione lyase family enzyme
MTMQIGSAVLYVADLASMVRFYESVLGLRPIDSEHRDVWQEFDAGPFRLGLHQIPKELLGTNGSASVGAPRERTPIKLVLAVSDVDAERNRLEALGVTTLVRAWGGIEIVDPEGNIFGLTQAIP